METVVENSKLLLRQDSTDTPNSSCCATRVCGIHWGKQRKVAWCECREVLRKRAALVFECEFSPHNTAVRWLLDNFLWCEATTDTCYLTDFFLPFFSVRKIVEFAALASLLRFSINLPSTSTDVRELLMKCQNFEIINLREGEIVWARKKNEV